MFDIKIAKRGIVSQVTGFREVTLRSWDSKGWLLPLGLVADGTTKRFSLIDVCVLKCAAVMSGEDMHILQALQAAVELRGVVQEVVETPRSDSPQANIRTFGYEPNFWDHWQGFAAIRKQRPGEGEGYEVAHIRDLEELSLMMKFGRFRTFIRILDVGEVCQEVATLLAHLQPEHFGRDGA